MTRSLPDVSVLIALIDPTHVQDDLARAWFAKSGKKAWAKCPLAKNGVLRIVGHPPSPNSPGAPAAVAELMMQFLALPGHEFWPIMSPILDGRRIHGDRLLESAQVTDSYLLALAVEHHGQLATFDQKIVSDGVVNGTQALQVIV